jgi:hypothetical protein
MKIFKFNKAILILIAISFCGTLVGQTIYVSPNGNDSNSGVIDSPLATIGAAISKSRQSGTKKIEFFGGRYYFETTINLDSQDNGLSIRSVGNEKVIFDGGKNISSSSFSLVSDNLGGRIKNDVVGKLYSSKITDAKLISLLKQKFMGITIDDKMINLSRFPNEGIAIIEENSILKDLETPGATGTHADPKGAAFKLNDYFSFNNAAWEAEIQRNKKIAFSGYVSADWTKENINKDH